MLFVSLVLLSLCGNPAPAGPPVPSARTAQTRDPLQRFHTWFDRMRRGRSSFDSTRDDDLQLILGDLQLVWAIDPTRGPEIATALLDLLGYCTPIAGGASADLPTPDGLPNRAAVARDFALETLRAHVDPEFLRWLTRDVLAVRSQPVDRRVAAITVIDGRREPAALLPLLSCAKENEPRVRFAALEALVGWDDESVNLLFLDELSRALSNDATAGGDAATDGGVAVAWLAEEHFAKLTLPPASPLLPRLALLVARGLASSNWREVSRAITLARPLDAEAVVPFLIEALARWKSREEAGAQALRVEMEIVRELEARSGRKLGLSPADWSAWWRAFRRGEAKITAPRTGGYRETTRASFFGIAAATDRVTFVIDRSGSMETQFGPDTGGRRQKRWEAAVEQLLGFLDAIGPRARFDVVVFHDYAEEWRPTLQLADAENKKDVGAWLEHHHPGGGTHLYAGIAKAMHLQPDGLPELAALEADTIIVLCDGETAEGPGWVPSFLLTANARARIVFHCVKIGPGGDGTLEKLAAGSGGDFVRVDG